MKKTAIVVVAVVTTVSTTVVLIMGLAAGGFFFLAPRYRAMDNYLEKNIDELTYVFDALSELYVNNDYDSMSINKFPLREEEKYSIHVRTDLKSDTIPIPDELVSHIESLYDSGVRHISWGSDSIGFTMWSIMYESRGIEFDRTGEPPTNIQYIELRELSKENWYYYVDNYEKAKARNPELFR